MCDKSREGEQREVRLKVHVGVNCVIEMGLLCENLELTPVIDWLQSRAHLTL